MLTVAYVVVLVIQSTHAVLFPWDGRYPFPAAGLVPPGWLVVCGCCTDHARCSDSRSAAVRVAVPRPWDGTPGRGASSRSGWTAPRPRRRPTAR